jgi:hypothetical protein
MVAKGRGWSELRSSAAMNTVKRERALTDGTFRHI